MPSNSAGGPPPLILQGQIFYSPGVGAQDGDHCIMHREIEIENYSMFTFRKLIRIIKKKKNYVTLAICV